MSKSLFRKKNVNDIISDHAALSSNEGMKRVLGVRDLTALGVAAIIGAGIFSSIGKASYEGGPAVVFLYIFTAIACGFAAICYAEFASTVPVAGSAYTYAYVAFGEIIAWVIGWCLIMEYAIGNIACAISWSDYLTGLLAKTSFAVPPWLSMDYWSAQSMFNEATGVLQSGGKLTARMNEGMAAWEGAPQIGAMRIIMDVPAFFIVLIITAIVFVGIRESKRANNLFVLLKLLVVFMVIVVGSFYLQPENWSPFAPEGMVGVLKGVSAVFFAYIGFDAISTTAEECKNPQRDLPKAMMYSLGICAVLYVLVALVLTGMVHYTQLNVGDPLASVFDGNGLYFMGGIVAFSAIIATASVMLVFQIGQPRIWMTMGRDGLLPKKFAQLHPKWQTPAFATLITGLLVGVPSLFLNLDLVISLTSIGTLFAFIIVCAGVLILPYRTNRPESRFKVPFINSRWILPLGFVLAIALIIYNDASYFSSFFNATTWQLQFPMLLFWLVVAALVVLGIRYQLSLIPVLGIISCFYLMAQESLSNWLGFGLWLLVGLIIYFCYGYWKSRLRKRHADLSS